MNAVTDIRAARTAPRVAPLGEWLDQGFAPKLLPVSSDLREEILAYAAERAEAAPARRHATVLTDFCLLQRGEILRLTKAEELFQSRYASALDSAEQRAAILDFARALGSRGRQMKRDIDATKAFFDADAVLERFTRRLGERERVLAFALERLGWLAGEAVADDLAETESETFVEIFDVLLPAMRSWRGDARIRRAAHSCMRRIAERLPPRTGGLWLDPVLSATRRTCLEHSEDVWTQCEAFDAMFALSPHTVHSLVERRLDVDLDSKPPAQRDGEVFVRRHLVRLVCRHMGVHKRLEPSFEKLCVDADGAVRQVLAECIGLMPGPRGQRVTKLLSNDPDPQVRAALFADPAGLLGPLTPNLYARVIAAALKHDEDEFVLRIALDAAVQTAVAVTRDGSALPPALGAQLFAGIEGLRARNPKPKLWRWSDEARERIWLLSDPDARAIALLVGETASTMREGAIRRMPALRGWLQADAEKVGRVMAVLAQRDFGLALKPGLMPSIQRGEYFRRRAWRMLFEGRNSATDKRQAFYHTKGRHYHGSMIAPSARMAELAPTKVPGEPLFESGEGGWRNYLPLVDQILSALDKGGTTQVFTSAGITEISAPAGMLARTRAFWSVTRRFPRLAELRNRDPEAYIAALRELGLELSFRGYDERAGEPTPHIVKLYSAGGIFAALPVFWDRASAYVSTVFANNLVELGIFVALASAWFLGRHVLLGWHARRLRDGLSLVLGGWGTRGKSGTERLKAGLINALGPSIVSKTTGCEAMFLLGNPYGELTEMFLFRPYDKATIWEQYNLLKTSRGLKARVFLWECMGLNPAYVRVLQQDWMRDDIGTITNTYPDHEDVQGPAGRNIPEVMCEFIPHGSTLLTTEEEMLPILTEGAQKAGTRMRSIGWKEAGLIHKTLLDRFPYEEHPFNIALVTAMGDELGLEPDFCVKEMSDRVVADLGVLKTYPRAEIDGRSLQFVMGMSANERFGAMGNWTRMGFIDHDLDKDPEIFVTTVVNNRADRVPRSRVFARMLVRDVAADRHFLIGSNIEGLLGFIEEEWEAYAASISLVAKEVEPLARLDELAKYQRIALSQEALDNLLAAMIAPQASRIAREDALAAAKSGKLADALKAAGVTHAADIVQHYEAMAALHQDYAKLRDAVRGASDPAAHDAALRALLGKAFHAKLVPVRDYYMKGEAIVRLVAANTPPGLLNRIMGMQNIKGTGLDWVYRWQAWEAAWKACQQLREDDPAAVERGFRMLASFHEYGVLSEAELRSALTEIRQQGGQAGLSGAQCDILEARLDEQMKKLSGLSTDTGAGADDKGGRLAKFGSSLVTATEAFIDAGDAVRRRKAADRIYDALIAEQISNQRAAAELKALTSRQKGGWLAKGIKERRERKAA
ncbi:hypothetical protein K3172_02000 [Qipengyuania sp. 6B39]|uniref:hypothetical protein n=1 Tax=Qipengyuania proteolytica TaxID=2867239 RepID=UPI001C8A5BBC|nr:hypothetical protein [Qipengyuania proteolytica]MBX7494624.1 hypothetical protein [Qipengyuania proteolytica]